MKGRQIVTAGPFHFGYFVRNLPGCRVGIECRPMTSDQFLNELQTELLTLFRTFKPTIKEKYYNDPQMCELINRLGLACSRIGDFQAELELPDPSAQ